MSRSAAEISAGIVAGALAAGPGGALCQEVVDRMRGALGADRVLLVRAAERWATPAVVAASAAPGAEVRVDPDGLGAAFDATGPVALDPEAAGAPCLAVALRPRDEALWCLAIARAVPWLPADHDLLARLAPTLTLVLEHALLRQHPGGEASAEAMKAGRERFLAALSHELRNPLAPILMWTSTLRRLRGQDADVQRATQAIEYAVSLARRLIEDLSDVSRLERGVLELHPTVLDLRDVVRETLQRLRGDLDEARLTPIEELPSTAVMVEGDADRLQQVLTHLVRNAIKFTPPRGVVAVALSADDAQASLRVSDSGPGLPGAIVPQLFLPFVQGPNAHGGLGVGLAVSRWLVELHGGTVEAISPGDQGGTTIVVRLPVHAAHTLATGT